MKEKDRDTFDDLFRSKLYDFEVNTEPEDWEAIADRLPGREAVPLRRKLRYWAAAAVFALLMITGSIYLYDKDTVPVPIVQEIEKETKEMENRLAEDIHTPVVADKVQTQETQAQTTPGIAGTAKTSRKSKESVSQTETIQNKTILTDTDKTEEDIKATRLFQEKFSEKEDTADVQLAIIDNNQVLIADATPVAPSSQKTTSRKWGFGMGAGSLALGSNSMVPQYVTNSSSLRSESLVMMNSASFDREIPKTDIKHKTPISFGFSVSRYLNNRFALQTGLTYTFLRSDWETNGTYHGKTKQSLHFIGLPLSLTYRIAEWNRFNFYASAGGMTEVNVAGKTNTSLYSPTTEIDGIKENVRMKEWLWSLNANAGVSYPLIRFVSAFAEVGASYYFDNGSEIETIRSKKPFNVNLQFGFRLGF